MDFQIITNNPMVQQRLGSRVTVRYKAGPYLSVLHQARSLIQEGYTLLSHPLSGSVKPNETPYKSIMLSQKAGPAVQMESEMIIENCLLTCASFARKDRLYTQQVLEDFQYVDYTLIASAVEAAGLTNF